MTNRLTGFAVTAASVLMTSAATADLPWPEGLDTAVAAREAEVLPGAVTEPAAELDLLGGARRPSSAFGGVDAPFDSWRMFALPSAAIPFDTLTPGFLLYFR